MGIAVGGMLSDRVVAMLVKRKGGEPRPEYRLPTMMVGGFVVPVGLYMYGVSENIPTLSLVISDDSDAMMDEWRAARNDLVSPSTCKH